MNPYAAYEEFKKQIAGLNLTPEQYAEACRTFCDLAKI